MSDQGWLKREFRKAGVALVFVTGHQHPLYQAIDGAMAQNERKQIRERIAARQGPDGAERASTSPVAIRPSATSSAVMIGKTERRSLGWTRIR